MWEKLSVKILRGIASKYKTLHSLGNISKQKKSVLLETLKKVMEFRGNTLFTKAEHGNKRVLEIAEEDTDDEMEAEAEKEEPKKAKEPTPKAKAPTPKATEPTPKASPKAKAKVILLSIYDNAVNYITNEIFGKTDLGDIGRLVFNLDDGLMKASNKRLRLTDKGDRLFEELKKMTDQQKAKVKKGIEKILMKITTDKSFNKRGALDQFLRSPKLFTLDKVLDAEGFTDDAGAVYTIGDAIAEDNNLRTNFTSRTGLGKLLNKITSLLETIFLNR